MTMPSYQETAVVTTSQRSERQARGEIGSLTAFVPPG